MATFVAEAIRYILSHAQAHSQCAASSIIDRSRAQWGTGF